VSLHFQQRVITFVKARFQCRARPGTEVRRESKDASSYGRLIIVVRQNEALPLAFMEKKIA
jgi:hypothetical protein